MHMDSSAAKILEIVQARTESSQPTIIWGERAAQVGELLKTMTASAKAELLQPLTAILQAEVLPHRANAAYALGMIGPAARGAIGAMIAAMNCRLANVSQQVRDALPRIGAEYAVPALLEALGESPGDGQTSFASHDLACSIMDCFATLGPTAGSAAPHLATYLGNCIAVQALVSMGSPAVAAVLAEVQKTPEPRHPWVYHYAAKVLEGIGSDAIQKLKEASRSADAKNRSALRAVFDRLPGDLNVNITPDGETALQVLSKAVTLEGIQFNAGTRIEISGKDSALIEAILHEPVAINGTRFAAGTRLAFSGTREGQIVTAVITLEHDIQGVRLSASGSPITLEFAKARQQIRPGLKTARSKGAALVADGMPFKQDTPLVFYRAGHIGSGCLDREVMIGGLWFGARLQPRANGGDAEPSGGNNEGEYGNTPIVSAYIIEHGPGTAAAERDYDICFYPNGQVAYGILSRRQRVQDLDLEANGPIFFYPNGKIFGGTLTGKAVIDGIICRGAFQLQGNGKLSAGFLAGEQIIDGIKCSGEFSLYADGKLRGATLVGMQVLGPVTCVGHFTLHPNGMPDQVYLGREHKELGAPFHDGWLLRFGREGNRRGHSSRPPGYWKEESMAYVGAGFRDFFPYFHKQAVVCDNERCPCHRFDPIESSNFTSEIHGYQRKGWALMNRRQHAEAEAVQSKALALAEQYVHTFGGYHLMELCRDIARRLDQEGKYDEALTMLDRAFDYWEEYGKQFRHYRIEQCRIDFHRVNLYCKQGKYSRAESVLISLIPFCEADSSHQNSLQYYELSQAQKLFGDCYAAHGELVQAEERYKKALAVNPHEQNCLDVFEAYHALLDRMGETVAAADLYARIQKIKAQPMKGHICGQGAVQEQMWLSWQPTLDLD